jgi:hypothetical protein
VSAALPLLKLDIGALANRPTSVTALVDISRNFSLIRMKRTSVEAGLEAAGGHEPTNTREVRWDTFTQAWLAGFRDG